MGMSAHDGITHAVGYAEGFPHFPRCLGRLIVGPFGHPLIISIPEYEQGTWRYECRQFMMIDRQSVNTVREAAHTLLEPCVVGTSQGLHVT